MSKCNSLDPPRYQDHQIFFKADAKPATLRPYRHSSLQNDGERDVGIRSHWTKQQPLLQSSDSGKKMVLGGYA